MKMVSGAILVLASEQAFAHAHLVQFPNHEMAGQVLIPACVILVVLGVLLLSWGLLTEAKAGRVAGS